MVEKLLQKGFSLNTDAKVSIILADIFGNNIHHIVTDAVLDCGFHNVNIQKPTSGLYIISMVANGSVYEKKVKIQ